MALIQGTQGADTLTDSSSNDTIEAFAGNDTVTVTLGADTVDGGTGRDTLILDYAAATTAITTTASPSANAASGGFNGSFGQSGGARSVSYVSIERFVITTGSGNDVVVTASGDDIVTGGAGDDTITTGAGHDRLDGGIGFDRLFGGAGNDLYVIESGDQATENAAQGIDKVETALGAYFLPGNVENLAGTGFQQSLTGNALNNGIVGTGGADTLRGAGGDDLIVGAAGGDTLEGGDGRDLLIGAALDPTNLIVNGSFETVDGTNSSQDYVSSGGSVSGGTAQRDTATLHGWQKSTSYAFNLVADAGNAQWQTGHGEVVLDMESGAGENQSIYQDIAGLTAGTMLVVSFTASRFVGDNSPAVLQVLWNGEVIGTVVSTTSEMTQHSFLVTAAAAGGGAGGANRIGFRETGTIADQRGTMLDAVALHAVVTGADPHNNKLQGDAGDDVLVGDAGQDELMGGAGADVMIGGANDDLYFVQDATDIIIEKANGGTFDRVVSSIASYTLPEHVEDLSGALDTGQTLIGNAVYNRIYGGTGNDRIDGGGAADFLAGGQGNDTYVLTDTLDIISEFAGQGIDTIETALAAFSLVGYNNIENLAGTSATGQTLTGSAGANRISGGTGNDTLNGNGGADTLAGGAGDDIYIIDSMDDVVEEAAGQGAADEVRTALGSRSDYSQMYHLPSGVEKLTGTAGAAQGVYGNALDNIVKLGTGGDLVVLDGGGNDTADTGAGNDFIYYGGALDAADINIGGAGFDTVGLLGTYALTLGAGNLAGIEKLALYGSGSAAAPNSYAITTVDANVAAGTRLMVVAQSLAAGETLTFNGQAETDGSFNIRGGKGADTITGGHGNDQIWGNLGADTLKGGGGNDNFEYRAVAESTAAARDTILDFGGGDLINLLKIDADGNAANGDTRFAFIGQAAFSNVAGQLRAYQAQGGGWIVEGDLNGDGAADLVIAVTTLSGHSLGAWDFVL